jgi:GR25 family glycosyltransferase involved in LPS biosynthesis
MTIPILYINLDRSIDRNEKMVTQLNNFNVQYERISGIDAANIEKNALKNNNGEKCGVCDGIKYYIKKDIIFNPQQKHIAIILSHMKALKKIIENNFEIAIIMEDDLSFQYISNLNQLINDIILNAPSNWKIIKMHTSMGPEIIKNNNLADKGILYTPLVYNSIHSAGCYIIKKTAAIELLNKYNINETYTFPNKNEHCVCECIIFSISDIYMYTIPYICAFDNNITCNGGRNPADTQSNNIIHSYWKKKGFNTTNTLNIQVSNKEKNNNRYKFQTVKNLLEKKKQN